VGTVGRIILGFIGDRFGNRRTVFVSYALMGLAFFGLAASHSVGMLYVFAVIFGFFFGVGILLIPIITEYYGFKELGIISGTLVFSNSFGGAIGPPVAGGIFDGTGSYYWAFISCSLTGLVAAVIVYWLRQPANKGRMT
jgi:MFS family permease